VTAQLGHDRLVVPPAGADEELDGLAVDTGLDGDHERGGRTLLGPVEPRQVALEERGEPVLAAPHGLRGQDGIGEQGLGLGVIQE
jgi:hypothetical protein